MQKKRLLSILLAGIMAFGAVPCTMVSADEETTEETTEGADETAESDDYDAVSEEIYNAALGDFYDAYQEALEAETASERYAKFAISEAKLLESGVTVPTTGIGGTYRIGRVAPKSVSSVMWGMDAYRLETTVVTEELIKAEDVAAMKSKWAELKGTGEYLDWAKSYLEEQGYTLTDTLNYPYSYDPATWDCFASYLTSDLEPDCLTVDGLVQYDVENNIQPALAESWEVSDDGLTYTFHLRDGLKWVDSQGREVADLTADDFVAGLQHLLDVQGGMEYMVGGVIENAQEYINGDVTDFTQVGVKAVDDTTVEYTLVQPCTYFMSLLTHTILNPLSRSYYESQGGKFGSEYDSSAADYTYGKTSDNIAYCGPYIVTSATEKNKIVFSKNESYWNADNMNVATLNWIYEDGTDATKVYNDTIDGTISYGGLNTSAIEVAKSDGNFDQYAYVTDVDGTCYQIYTCLNRAIYANFNDDTRAVSDKTDEEKERTHTAVNNQHFRLAVAFAVDRGAYNAQTVGEDLKYNNMTNSIVPATFVSLDEDVTVSINGTDTTFAAGTYYGEILQAQIDADGYPMKVWDPEADDGIGSGNGYDGWYNPEEAAAQLETAIAELAEEGVTIDEDNPIYLDLPYPSSNESYANKENALKQSVESALGGKVIINLVDAVEMNDWGYAGYYGSYGYEMNFDLYDFTGWSPDYSDPSTYLGNNLPDYEGYMTKMLGIY